MAVAVIVAAGRGERLGFARPKALVALAGRPMVEWSVAALGRVAAIERIAVALPPGAATPTGTVAATGGATRSHSVRAGLEAVGPGDPVVVHDAARPLVAPETVERALAELAATGADAVVVAAAVRDTVKEVADDGTVRATLDRSRLWAVQTPQAFRRDALQRALDVDDDVLAAAGDDAWLVERAGGIVRVLAAPSENLKITTPIDLRVAELALTAGARGVDANEPAPC